jgi:hypothetical protein
MTTQELNRLVSLHGLEYVLDNFVDEPEDDESLKQSFNRLYDIRQKFKKLCDRFSADLGKKNRLSFGIRDVLRFTSSKVSHTLNGGTYLPADIAKERLELCMACDKRGGEMGDQCTICKCWLVQIPSDIPMVGGSPGKVWGPTESCPVAKWPARPKDGTSLSTEEFQTQLKSLADA